MIHTNFLSAASQLELEQCLRRHLKEYGIARHANAILLLDKGKSCAEIAEFLYLDDDTIRGRYKAFRQEGWDALALDGRHGRQSRLTPDEETKRSAWLDDRFCHSAGEIRAFITAAFGLGYSHSGCLKVLGRLGFEYRKPRALPRVADAETHAEFIAFYQDWMTKLPANEAVYFADATHPEHQTKPAFGWVVRAQTQRSKPLQGAAGSTSMAAYIWKNSMRRLLSLPMLAATIQYRFWQKSKRTPPSKSPIYVLWHNAAYHRWAAVKKWLSRPKCHIHLIQLPAYCPHLNPIERLWAILQAHLTHNRSYTAQKQFANAILPCLQKTIPAKWKDFRSQVSDKFRIISHQNFRVLV